MRSNDDYQAELIGYLLAIDSPDAMDKALASLLTPAEYQEISKRLQIFRLLREGVPHRKIAETLGVGIATVSRGSRALTTLPSLRPSSRNDQL
ncbi:MULTISPECIES: Trp family transcriptional regulator [unclassified Halomonas]|uniref:Trp family transcriptional regulator n=1 Tax=unclassified Halomonas TaxID=2609666 RepID=UPI0006DA6590|nr:MULTISPECIES: Trp family transcriptional regulator [unclassified Halomonas]KPQ26078.1 MAG: transcriptional repressor of trp operon TrpR [Halomonas sp. HL-93]SBR49393.1 TrpR family transcriptional regulator, trp operon repressor [Halomonas sp. HL-93]SNY96355.1 TrpR family transcriptional regulator, trp operon repressor [Halomonas sp. hl-4]